MIPPLQLHRTVHGELEGLFGVLDAALPWSETSPVTTGFAGTVLDATWGVGYLLLRSRFSIKTSHDFNLETNHWDPNTGLRIGIMAV